ncbi:MAG: FmdB family zinc ribbon protein [Candidatus Eisenbacteria bacterium]
MPTYEYVCASCGHEFELFQKMSDPPAKKCPECKGKVKRKIGAGAGLIFKGSGFYITDYRSEGYKKAAQADKSGSSSGGDSSGGGSKSKSDGKSKPKSGTKSAD